VLDTTANEMGVAKLDSTAENQGALDSDKATTISQHWDKLASQGYQRDNARLSWGGLTRVAQNHNRLTTGREDWYWIDYFRDTYFPEGQAGDVLSLGCGEGRIERLLKERGFVFRSVTGVDISQACIESATTAARAVDLAPEINYRAADVDTIELPEAAYDFIFFFHSLHHVSALEHVLRACARALRPGGILMVNEFVGPTRFQWTEEQLAMANSILSILPPELRVDLVSNEIKEVIAAPPVEIMIAIDPSEAVRSADIESVLQQYFNIIEEKPWGGTLTHILFENIAGNFDQSNPLHDALVRLIILHEDTLIANKVLPSDFKFLVARAKPESEAQSLRYALDLANSQLEDTRRQLEAVYASRSWRLLGPMRRLIEMLRRS